MFYQIIKTYSCNVGETNTTIYDSYKMHSIEEMKFILNHIKEQFPNSSINKRSNFSLINEWRTHNLLHGLGVYKSRTKDVDLNINQSIIFKVGYFIGSLFYLHW